MEEIGTGLGAFFAVAASGLLMDSDGDATKHFPASGHHHLYKEGEAEEEERGISGRRGKGGRGKGKKRLR